jgi:hypothetical protein
MSCSHETKCRRPKPCQGPAPRAVGFLFSFSEGGPKAWFVVVRRVA